MAQVQIEGAEARPTTYTIRIEEVVESDTGGVTLIDCKMNANSDEAAAMVMSDLLLSVSKHNHLEVADLNANLYKTQWINGI